MEMGSQILAMAPSMKANGGEVSMMVRENSLAEIESWKKETSAETLPPVSISKRSQTGPCTKYFTMMME